MKLKFKMKSKIEKINVQKKEKLLSLFTKKN